MHKHTARGLRDVMVDNLLKCTISPTDGERNKYRNSTIRKMSFILSKNYNTNLQNYSIRERHLAKAP